jgi:hypothetical protein
MNISFCDCKCKVYIKEFVVVARLDFYEHVVICKFSWLSIFLLDIELFLLVSLFNILFSI